MIGTALREPPEGVLAGENVPVENDAAELRQGRVEEVAARLAATSTGAQMSEAKRRQMARRLTDE